MTMSTLIMAVGVLLGVVLLSAALVLAVVVVWYGQRVGSVADVREENIETRAEIKSIQRNIADFDEKFETYKARANQRLSTESKNRQKEKEADADQQAPQPMSRDDIVRQFERSLGQ